MLSTSWSQPWQPLYKATFYSYSNLPLCEYLILLESALHTLQKQCVCGWGGGWKDLLVVSELLFIILGTPQIDGCCLAGGAMAAVREKDKVRITAKD